MSNHPNPIFMDAAIQDAQSHISLNEGGPFGACIVKGDEIISVGHNTVLKNHDATCHAEVNAIQAASQKLNTHDLADCVIYATTEPCPMCFSAIHWANIQQIVFGTRIDDVQSLGFRELSIDNQTMKRLGHSDLIITEDFEREKCLDLLKFWQTHSQNTTY